MEAQLGHMFTADSDGFRVYEQGRQNCDVETYSSSPPRGTPFANSERE
jgi:hypothetical protein